MADHTRRILRNWQFKIDGADGTGTYFTVETIPYTTFLEAGSIVGLTDKWAAYGRVSGMHLMTSTGSAGMHLPFIVYRGVAQRLFIHVGTVTDLLGTTEQFVNARLDAGYENLIIEAKALTGVYGTPIVNVQLDLLFVGGSGPGI